MELLEWALEAEPEADRASLIAGAPVPTAIRRIALDLLEVEGRSGETLDGFDDRSAGPGND